MKLRIFLWLSGFLFGASYVLAYLNLISIETFQVITGIVLLLGLFVGFFRWLFGKSGKLQI